VARNGSLAYRRIEQVDIGEPEMALEPGFAVAIVEQRPLGGEYYGRTNRGLWVPMRDLGAARPIRFRGVRIGDQHLQTPKGTIAFAWIYVDRAQLYARRGSWFVPTAKTKARFEQVAFLERQTVGSRSYVRIDETNWIAAKSIRHPTIATPPANPPMAPRQRWIDIELASQTLVAYEGSKPVYATLISTGKRRRGPLATPKGTHRIWVKLLTSVMDNLENEWASRYYRIEDVPYVQYFAKGVGLHAAFWHRSFGRVRSHGCVNLTPLDAYWLFWWTGPHLPAGWTAVLPTSHDQGTVVRVR